MVKKRLVDKIMNSMSAQAVALLLAARPSGLLMVLSSRASLI